MKVKVAQSIRLFVTPWTLQPMEFSRPEHWSGQPFPSPGDLPNPGIKPRSPALWVDSFTRRAIREAYSQVQSPGREDPLVKEMATHSSVLA